ncbi:MAG TPA: hypothetical protein VF011_21405 [Terriglobales bacterium]
MADDSFPTPGPFPGKPTVRTSCGEVLRDGSVLDLVADGDRLMLCHWDGSEFLIVPYFESDGVVYRPPTVQPSLYRAMRFPASALEYGSRPALFEDTSKIFKQWGASQDDAYFWSFIALSSWVPELFPTLLTLVVSGSDIDQVAILFKVFSCVCRRGLMVPELSRCLPFDLRPTLLILSAELSAKQSAFWRASNIPGVQVPTRAGAVESLGGTRVLFTDNENFGLAWGSGVCRFRLLPYPRLSSISEQEMTQIAAEYQPKFLRFRLEYLRQINAGPPQQKDQSLNYGAAGNLLSGLREEPEIVASMIPILDAQQAEMRECEQRDPYRVILESIWSPSHEAKKISITELTKRVNDILRSRGETSELDSRVVGWKLRNLCLPRERTGDGMHLRFLQEVRHQVHQLASKFQLNLRRFEDCTDCTKG